MTLRSPVLVLVALLTLLALVGACQASNSVAATVRSAWDPIMVSASEHFQFTFVGKLTTADPDSFWLDDGSPHRLRVVSPGYSGLKDGDWVRATGTVAFEDKQPVLVADDLTTEGYDAAPRSISGHIRKADGIPVTDVFIYTSDGGYTYANTDSDGYYAIHVPKGWSGTLAASWHPLYSFSPGTRDYNNVTVDIPDQDLLAVDKLVISGYVRTADGTPVGDIYVKASSGEYGYSDSYGHYALRVPLGWSGTVAAYPNSTYYFAPVTRDYSNMTADQPDQNFLAIPKPVISGHIRTADGTPIADVELDAHPNIDNSYTKTDSSGFYSFVVPPDWSGTVYVRQDTFYTFNPQNRDYAHVTSDQTNSDFEAVAMPVISGYVRTADGTPVVDVYVEGCHTDSNGYYAIWVPSGWTGTVAPHDGLYTFSPPSLEFTNVTTDQPNQNFEAIARPMISGHLRTASGTPVAEVYLFASNGECAYADSDGYYSVHVPKGWSGSVTLSQTDLYTFSPESREYANVIADQPDQNFEAIAKPIISGYVRTLSGTPLENVQVYMAADGYDARTDSDGHYSLLVPTGWSGRVDVLPDYDYAFDPSSRQYIDVTADQPNQDYEAMLKPSSSPPSSPSRLPATSP